MRIYLSSLQDETRDLCREVLNDLFGHQCEISLDGGLEADLFIWDVSDASMALPRFEERDRWRHFFLIGREQVNDLRASMQDPNLILKPVSKGVLAALLSQACRNLEDRPAKHDRELVDSLRADRGEILQCLLQANLKLQEYDHDRTNFLARAIHDFRAPLTAITGYCGILLSDDIGPLTGQQREVIERMHRAAKKLSRMASAMFQLSIAPRVEVTLDLRNDDIQECIEHAIHEISPAAAEKHISVSVDVVRPPGALFFERTKLEQVLVNLLDNACKFSSRAGTIDVSAYPFFWDRRSNETPDGAFNNNRRVREERAPNSYRVDIRDNGPGVPAAYLTKIFEEYTSYSGCTDRSGGGLGLAICRMIVNQHKGKIWAESTQPGTVFSLVLPYENSDRSASTNQNLSLAMQARAL